MQALIQANEAITKLKGQNPDLDLDSFSLMILDQVKFLKSHTGRVILIDVEPDDDPGYHPQHEHIDSTQREQPQTRPTVTMTAGDVQSSSSSRARAR